MNSCELPGFLECRALSCVLPSSYHSVNFFFLQYCFVDTAVAAAHLPVFLSVSFSIWFCSDFIVISSVMFLIYMSNIIMHQCNQLCSSCRCPSVHLPCVAKTFMLDITCKTCEPKWVTPAMFIGTIDLYHFVPLLVTLIVNGSHKVNIKQDLLATFSCTLFN